MGQAYPGRVSLTGAAVSAMVMGMRRATVNENRLGWSGTLLVLLLTAAFCLQAAEATGALPCVHNHCIELHDADGSVPADQEQPDAPGGCDHFCLHASPGMVPESNPAPAAHPLPGDRGHAQRDFRAPDAPVFSIEQPPRLLRA